MEQLQQGEERVFAPYNDIAERSVISCMLQDSYACEKGLLSLTRDNFLSPDCARVFSAIQLAKQQGFEVGLQSVSSILDSDFLEKLIDIAQSLPTSANFDVYVKTLQEEQRNRKFVHEFTALVESAKQGEEGFIAKAQEALNDLTKDTETGLKPIREFLPEAVFRLGSQEKGISSGFYDLDKVTRGLCKGDLIVVAGRPSMGKSSFAANVAANAAKDGHVVCYFSLEMTSVSIVQRMIYGMVGHSESEIVSDMKSNNPTVVPKVLESQARIEEMKFYLNESSSVTVNKIALECKKVQIAEGNVDLVVIDYLGLIQSEPSIGQKTRNQEVAEISHAMKRLAKELNCPVMLVSQLNRNSEGRSDHTPMLSDLSESGAVEADADVILFPYRPWVYDKERLQTEAELIVAKNRNGETKRIPLYWQGDQFIFKNVAKEY